MQQVQSNLVVGQFDMYHSQVSFSIGDHGTQRVTARLQMVLPCKCLITNVSIAMVDSEMILKYFGFLYGESLDCYESRSPVSQHTDFTNMSVLLVTKKFRLVFSFEEKNLKDFKEFEEMFKLTVTKVQVFGYQLYATPPANQMVSILNASHFLKKHQQEMSAADSDILLGLCLISSRRFLQAAEIFKKVAIFYAQKANQASPEHSEHLQLMASSLQILVADSINQPSMINEKLQSLIQCVRNNEVPQTHDLYDCVLRIHGDLIKVICKVLPSKISFDALKMAHLRCLEFLIEQLGCELGDQIIGLIRLLSRNYSLSPIQPMYQKLLVNLQQTLPHLSAKLRTLVWKDLVEQELFQHYPQEIKTYYIKLAEFAIEITEGEVPLSMHFMNSLIRSQDPAHIKLWTYINDVSVQYQTPKFPRKIQKFIMWSVSNLNDILGFQAFSLDNVEQLTLAKRYLTLIKNSLNVLNADHVGQKNGYLRNTFESMMAQSVGDKFALRQIYRSEQISIQSLLVPMKQLLQESVNRKINLEVVSLVMEVLQQVQLSDPGSGQVYALLLPYLHNIVEFCRNSTPQIDLLRLILALLQAFKPGEHGEFMLEFMRVFCGCMPHSIYDETFYIFDALVALNIELMEPECMERCILALIDQYTVKGKAQKTSKHQFISRLCSQHIISLVTICLYRNSEPTLKRDEKVFTQDLEIFFEKLTIAHEAMAATPTQGLIVKELSTNQEMVDRMGRLLASPNSKIRWKALAILSTYYDILIKFSKTDGLQLQDLIESSNLLVNQKLELNLNEPFIGNFLKLLSTVLLNSSDEKSLHQALVLVEQMFGALLSNEPETFQQPLLRTILEMWDPVTLHSNSHWQSVNNVLCRIVHSWAKIQDISAAQVDTQQAYIAKMVGWISMQLQRSDRGSLVSALRTCGTFLGLRITTLMHPHKAFDHFKRYANLLPTSFWDSVSGLQLSTHQDIKWMSICIMQCCAPSQVVINWFQQRYGQINIDDNLSGSVISLNSFPPFNSVREVKFNQVSETVNSQQQSHSIDNVAELWLRSVDVEHLAYILRVLFEDAQLGEEAQRQQFPEDDEVDVNISYKEEKKKEAPPKVPFLDDEPLDFDELGIIEVDDEEWNEYDDLRKVPILKGKMKTISPSQIKKEEVTRKWSGTLRSSIQHQEMKTDDLKLLRPHNPLFRPLTPPIGSNSPPSLLNNMEIFQNYALQNPDEFQKIIDGIRMQTQAPPQETHSNSEELEPKMSLPVVPIKVDELEYDPHFSRSAQNIHKEQQPQQKKEKKAKKLKKNTEPRQQTQSQSLLSFKDLKKLWEQSIAKKRPCGKRNTSLKSSVQSK